MHERKKSEEWIVMRYFREKYELFPKGKLVKSESPDFILKVNRRKQIGIELTRFDHLAAGKSGGNEVIHQLKKLITQKEDKLRIYQKKLLNEYWLIISVESLDVTLEIKDTTAPGSIFTSTFDKVFFFDLFSASIIQLR